MTPYAPPNPYAPSATAPTPYRTEPVMVVNERAIDLLRQTRPWVMFLSVLMFLSSGLMVVVGFGMIAMSMVVTKTTNPLGPWLGLFYLPIGAFYVYPAIKLWSYASAIANLGTSRATNDLEAALEQQKSFWKFCGIGAIVMMGLYAVGMVGMVVFGVATAMQHTH